MADRPPKQPDPLDDPIDILPPHGDVDVLDWVDDDDVAIGDDPLDEDDLLLSQADAPLPPASAEPPASPLPEPPRRPAPDASWPDGPEPEGDDLSWTEAGDDDLPEQAWPAAEEAAPATGTDDEGDWVPDEPPPDDALWIGLEDERLVTIGVEERASLPALRRMDLRARPSTLHARSVLRTTDEALVAMGEITTPVHLGGAVVSVTLAVVAASVEELIVARDVLAGRFLVDAGRRDLLGGRDGESG